MADPTIPPEDSPFATMSPKQALASLNRAIMVIESGAQMYRIGDRQVLRGDLRWMYPERKRLEAKVAALTRGGMRMRRIVPL
jgi:hypothetical protein